MVDIWSHQTQIRPCLYSELDWKSIRKYFHSPEMDRLIIILDHLRLLPLEVDHTGSWSAMLLDVVGYLFRMSLSRILSDRWFR